MSLKCFFCCLWIRTMLGFLHACKGIPTVHVALGVLYRWSWLEVAEVGMWITYCGCFSASFIYIFFSAFCICFGVMVVANPRVDSLWVRPNSYSLHVQLVTDKKYVTTGQCFIVFLIKLLWCSFWWMMITKQSQCSLLVKQTIRLLVSVPLDLN